MQKLSPLLWKTQQITTHVGQSTYANKQESDVGIIKQEF